MPSVVVLCDYVRLLNILLMKSIGILFTLLKMTEDLSSHSFLFSLSSHSKYSDTLSCLNFLVDSRKAIQPSISMHLTENKADRKHKREKD